MANWMRRRIERSRARCDRAATHDKPDKRDEETKQVTAQDGQAPSQGGASQAV